MSQEPATALLAAAAASPVNFAGVDAVLGSVLGSVILLIAIRVILHASKAAWPLAISATGIVLLGVLLFGFASSGDVGALGGDLFRLVFRP